MIEPSVFLVGAGPGDPGLLTLRAVECLAMADAVVYDKLVPPALLDRAPPHARRICVSNLPGQHPERWPHIHAALIELAGQGLRVVRLKGGDPLVFGRGGEEVEALRAAGIGYEIVPGITAALAAAAGVDVPLTRRGLASAVAFVTGHENPLKGDCSLDWGALARFPGTLAIYMGMARLPMLVQVLTENGKSPETPVVVVQDAGTNRQRSAVTKLGELVATVTAEGLVAPALILIGDVVRQRPERSWLEERPLFGRRVLVTRPRGQGAGMVRRLELLGAVPFVLPVVECRPPASWDEVDRAIGRLAEFDWLVFTSANGVQSFFGRLREIGRDLRALGNIQLAAIGPGTAEALHTFHLDADLVPAEHRSEALAAALKPLVVGKRVLLARADRGRDLLRQELAAVTTMEQIAVYSQVDAVEAGHEVFDRIRRGEIEFVTLTSANIARAFLKALDKIGWGRIEQGTLKLVSISPVTSAAIRELGGRVSTEAEIYTMAGVVAALLRTAVEA